MQDPTVSLTTFLDPWIIIIIIIIIVIVVGGGVVIIITIIIIIIIIIVLKYQGWGTLRPFPLDLVDAVVSILILATPDHKYVECMYAY